MVIAAAATATSSLLPARYAPAAADTGRRQRQRRRRRRPKISLAFVSLRVSINQLNVQKYAMSKFGTFIYTRTHMQTRTHAYLCIHLCMAYTLRLCPLPKPSLAIHLHILNLNTDRHTHTYSVKICGRSCVNFTCVLYSFFYFTLIFNDIIGSRTTTVRRAEWRTVGHITCCCGRILY